MTPKRKRFYIIFATFSFFCFVVGAILIVLQDNILFFDSFLTENSFCLK